MTGTLYEALGGGEGIRRIVDGFYDRVERSTVFRPMFPADLTETRTKTWEFLVGWTGGPPLYVSKYGHPRLRMRHLPFLIGFAERDEWMRCMTEAVVAAGIGEPAVSAFLQPIAGVADFMRNNPAEPTPLRR